MDGCVLPTYREGFPVVPTEAAAMELPVVATEVAGCVGAVQDSVTLRKHGLVVSSYSTVTDLARLRGLSMS